VTNNILVVAPHPDDETFGASGVICKCLANAGRVTIVFLTSGGASHKGCCDIPSAELETKREITSRRAAQLFGISDTNLHYLRLPDGRLPHRDQPGFTEATELLAAILKTVKPSQVYATHPAEGWSDHTAGAQMAESAIQSANSNAELFYYCVWLWLSVPFGVLAGLDWSRGLKMDIDEFVDTKQQAVRLYVGDKAPCGNPYCGILPQALIEGLKSGRELYFRAHSTSEPESRR
jgi:LmbE family N-acetylglucosaminyl deacetylase